MKKYTTEAFESAYKTLNEEQREAVDTIYGPVMSIAGPGTGKTQLLAVRVCNIIAKTDMSPHNILCLTFTDAGTKAMRQRLLKFMGPDAYHVGVFTYHSFCNQVIREHPEYFSEYRELSNASDLDIVEVIMELIDNLPLDHQMKRLKGDLYNDLPRLRSLFQTLKREGWTSEDIEKAVNEYSTVLETTDGFFYRINRGGHKIGDPNVDKITKEIARFDKLIASSKLLDQYQSLLINRDRIDYDDSINYVINAFKNNPDLLADYQERYQFILADEYQDTNGTQNEILFQLSSYDDHPNLFVVGDDDQSIYRFQGANMNNIVDFRKQYNPKEIVLDKNYRSAQPILDAAMNLIQYNKQRLAYHFEHLNKNLTESRIENHGQGSIPEVLTFENPDAQNIGIIQKIQTLVQNGAKYSDFAVIYRKHREAEDLLKYCNNIGIPVNIKKKVNVLAQPLIKQMVNILDYVDQERQYPHNQERQLFEILHFFPFGLRATDIARLAMHCSRFTDEEKDNLKWREVLQSEVELKSVGISDISAFLKTGEIIDGWISSISQVTIQVLFEKILTESGCLYELLHDDDRSWKLQIINTLFNFIKEETSNNPDVTLSEILSKIEKLENYNLGLPVTHIIPQNDGINFMTAHGSKGLEFNHVFIINCNDDTWVEKGNNSRNSFTFPPTIVNADAISDEEDDRRLFYVALTRAENHAYICHTEKVNDKELTPARFIAEMGLAESAQKIIVEEEAMSEYMLTLLKYEKGEASLVDKSLVDHILETLHINATGVSKYMRCKTAFYFENILRVPSARTANMGYGNAIHYALERYIKAMDADPQRKIPSADLLISLFEKGMEKFKSHFTKVEYEYSLYNGKITLPKYLEELKPLLRTPRAFKTEYEIKSVYNGIPISGVIDRVDIHDHHIDITDYKTGSYISAKLAAPGKNQQYPDGGDYWRQLIFYKILIDSDPKQNFHLKKAIIHYTQEDKEKFNIKTFEGDQFDVDTVGQQIVDAYEGITNHIFSPGCGESDCKWCNFVNENMSPNSPLAGDFEDNELEYSAGD